MPADKYPGLQRVRTFWDNTPWSRVTFGLQFIISPDGQYMLSTGPQRHFRVGESEVFRGALEESLKRLVKIRKTDRGSAEESEAIRLVEAQNDQDWKSRHPYYASADQWTADIFKAAHNIEYRFSNVTKQPEPIVRRQVCELLGRYAHKTASTRFSPGGDVDFFGAAVFRLLDDPVEDVRHAAAVAIFRFMSEPVPEVEGAALIDAARTRWTKALTQVAVLDN